MPKMGKVYKGRIGEEQLKERNYFAFRRLSRNQIIGVAIMSLFVVFSLIFCIVDAVSGNKTGTKPYDAKNDFVSYNTGWTIKVGSGSESEVELSDTYLISASDSKAGVTLIKKLNADSGSGKAIGFTVKNLDISAFVDLNDNGTQDDGESVEINHYSDGNKGYTSPSLFLLSLKDGDQGHKIYVTASSVNDYSSYLQNVLYGKTSAIYHKVYTTSLIKFVPGLFMAVICLIISIISFADATARKSAPQLAILSMFGTFIGFFVVMESGLLAVVTPYRYIWYFLKIVFLVLAAWFLAFYMYLKASNVGFLKLSRVFIWVPLILSVLIAILSVLKNYNAVVVLPMALISLYVTAIFSFINAINLVKHDKSQLVFLVESGVLLFFLSLEGIFTLAHIYQIDSIMIVIGSAIAILISIIAEYQMNVIGSKKLLKDQQHEQDQKVAIMLAQIQPHFLYNSLNSIAILCDINPKQAHDLTLKFSQYLRNNIDALSQQTPILFSTELKNIRNYLDIEKVRFSDKLNVVENIQVSDFFVPVLTIQPIVENAVKHGISKRSTPGVVMITTNQDLNNYYVTVEDNGVGFDPSILETSEKLGKSIGLSNVKYRLKSIMGADLSITSQIGKGTKVIITLPKVTNNVKGKTE